MPPVRPAAWHRADRKPALYVTTRDDRALVRGPLAAEALAATGLAAEWSPAGRGHVIDAAGVADLEAWAASRHQFLVMTTDKQTTETAYHSIEDPADISGIPLSVSQTATEPELEASACPHGVDGGSEPDSFVSGRLRCTECRAAAQRPTPTEMRTE